MGLNSELQNLYDAKWDDAYDALKAIKCTPVPANPLMISIKDETEFKSADWRVMFFGRETSGGDWRLSDMSIKHSVEKIMVDYHKFFDEEKGSGGGDDKQWQPKNNGMGGGMNLFKNCIEKRFPDKKIRYVWNNIIKSGVDGSFPSEQIRSVVFEHFNVLKDEINIIKPDIIIFAPGVKGYAEIERYFRLLEYSTIDHFPENKLVRVYLPDFPFVKYAFRMYHFAGRYSKKNIFEKIVDIIEHEL